MSKYKEFITFLEKESGIVIADGKSYLIESRLRSVLKESGFDSYDLLFNKIITGSDLKLRTKVIDLMTTNETLWFRDNYPYTFLNDIALPDLAKSNQNINIWSAASSSGQEAYSIAMIAHEFKSKTGIDILNKLKILGTDISSEMNEKCKEGTYEEIALIRGLSSERRKLFFTDNTDGTATVTNNLKKMTDFKNFNLLHFNRYSSIQMMDVIFCRNVLIYFSEENKAQILDSLFNRLKIGGYLIVGGSESIGKSGAKYKTIRHGNGIIYKKEIE